MAAGPFEFVSNPPSRSAFKTNQIIMAFHSFHSSHRLHWGASRPWSDSLPVQLDRVLHELSLQLHGAPGHLDSKPDALSMPQSSSMSQIGFVVEPGP
jgi:hypothetical protein